MENDSPTAPGDPPSSRINTAVLAVLVLSVVGGLSLSVLGLLTGNGVVLEAAGGLSISTGVLVGVCIAARRRARAQLEVAETPQEIEAPPRAAASNPWLGWPAWLWRRVKTPQGWIAVSSAAFLALLLGSNEVRSPRPALALATAAVCLFGVSIAASAATYFAKIDPQRLPEGPALSRGARLMSWLFLLSALAVGLAWLDFTGTVRTIQLVILALESLVCIELFLTETRPDERVFPANLRVLVALGSRANPISSAGDALQERFGIDLRSTWALDLVRRSAEPIILALVVLGWLSTSLTVVGVEEAGLVEHYGVPDDGPPLEPGVHLHWPWPADRVVRVPTRRVQELSIGHEEEKESGPEDVLWARRHSKSEYTLLLGDGRDLIAIDAAVTFRIADPAAWWYHTQNPADALRAIGYRAVMKLTVGLTLTQALSENVATLTQQIRSLIQADADATGLGVEIVGFTVGGMHPPVRVATDYQAVVSAALRKTTAGIDAQAYANKILPAAESMVVKDKNAALAAGFESAGKAAGEAWSFRALEAEVKAAPEEYRFRRRLESLETGLKERRYTVVDGRIQRDGGELWLMK